MCGRYTVSTPGDVIAEVFGLAATPDLPPRYNVAPTQSVPVVRRSSHGAPRELAMVRWGLVPRWAKDPEIGNRLINARAETVAEKPAFKSSFRRQRCLAVADGFYEWKPEGKRKQPWYFRRRDGAPFAIAALWARWPEPAGGDLDSCALLTTAANALLAPVHERMPVILAAADFDLWLDPEANDLDALQGLLVAADPAPMEGFAVSLVVNNPAHDRPECVVPLGT